MAAYAAAVSDPQSASYHQYLTPDQFQARYGATPQQVQAVESWLRGSGLTITAVDAHTITASGSISATERAYGTSLHQYTVQGKSFRAPVRDAQVPASVAGAVLTVVGLDNMPIKMTTSSLVGQVTTSAVKGVTGVRATATEGSDGAVFLGPSKCSSYFGQLKDTTDPAFNGKSGYPYAICGYVPSQLRGAYGVSASGLTGRGVTVAVVDAYGSTTMLADANQYAVNHGDAPFRAGQYTEYVTPANWENVAACGGAAGWAPEEALDVEMAHGYAPNANVVYVGGNSCSDADLLSAWQLIVDNHLADIVSNSWGEIMHGPAGYFDTSIIAPYEQTLEQATIEGIGFTVSSGDCGDNSPAAAAGGANCDPNTTEAQTQWPASDQWVTAVGGTALAISNTAGKYKFETSMGDLRSVLSSDGTSWQPFPGFFYFGGGGGTSEDFNQPWYQTFAVPSQLSHNELNGTHTKAAHRVIPDVAMSGDLIASTLVGISDGSPYSEAGYGGTSVSAPSFAGILADAIQARHGVPLGFANPALYLRQGLYTDVVENPSATGLHNGQTLSAILDLGLNADGSRRVRDYALGQDYGLTAAHGFDNATGLGSPNALFLESFRFGFPF